MAIKKFTISKIYINHEDKDKKPFVTAKGKKFWKVAIQVEDKDCQGEYLTDLIFNEDDPRFDWKAGHTVSIIIKRNNQYLNFSLPDKFDFLEERIENIESLLNAGKGPKNETNDAKILGTDELDGEIDGEIDIKDKDLLPF